MMKKILKVCLFIILLCCIDTKAANYVSCYYEYSPENGICGSKGNIYVYRNNKVLLYLAYNSENSKFQSPKLFGVVVDKKNTFDDIELSKYTNSMCNSGSNFCFSLPTSIPIDNIKNSSGSYVCPSIYIDVPKCDQLTKPLYVINLEGRGEELTSDASKSKTNTDNVKPPADSKSCAYNVDSVNGFTMGNWSGSLTFNIDSDFNVINIMATGSIKNNSFEWKDDKLSSNKCPDYIKLNRSGISNTIEIVNGTIDDYNGVYAGKINDADENSGATSLKYFGINNSTSYILVNSANGSGEMYLNNTFLREVAIDNYTEFTNFSLNPPAFIYNNANTNTFFFSKSSKTDVKIGDTYVLPSALYKMNGFSDEGIKNACEDIFGNEFLNLLNDNVFKIIYIAIPIILLVYTSYDFAKVVFSDDKDELKKAGTKFGKRVIAAILIYLVPNIFIFIANMLGAGDDIQSCYKTLKDYQQKEISETNVDNN